MMKKLAVLLLAVVSLLVSVSSVSADNGVSVTFPESSDWNAPSIWSGDMVTYEFPTNTTHFHIWIRDLDNHTYYYQQDYVPVAYPGAGGGYTILPSSVNIPSNRTIIVTIVAFHWNGFGWDLIGLDNNYGIKI